MTADPPLPPSPDRPPEGYLRIGRLGRAVGLEGGLRFQPLGRGEAAALRGLEQVFVEGLGMDRLRGVRTQGRHMVMFLARVRRVEQARPLVHATVWAPRAALPEAPAAPYRDELVGARVTLDGAPYGVVRDVLEAGPQELLVVAADGGGEALVPLRAPYVELGPDGVALVDPPEGLLDG